MSAQFGSPLCKPRIASAALALLFYWNQSYAPCDLDHLDCMVGYHDDCFCKDGGLISPELCTRYELKRRRNVATVA